MISIRNQAIGSAVFLATCGVVVAGVLRSELPCCKRPEAASSGQAASSQPALPSPPSAPQSYESPAPAASPEAAISASDIKLASVYPSQVEKKFWKVAVKKIWLRPPCCGACSVLKQSDFRTLSRVLSDKSKDTPDNRAVWAQFNTVLMVSLSRQEPDMYKDYIQFRKSGKLTLPQQGL